MKTDDDELACAWIVLFGTWEKFDDVKLTDDCLSAEMAVIKQDLFDKLSDEAKEILLTIINSPTEFAEFCVVDRTGKFKRRKNDDTYFIKIYFRKIWGSRLKVKKAFSEIENFIKKI